MIFLNENWNGTGEIVVYSNYHKYWEDLFKRGKKDEFE